MAKKIIFTFKKCVIRSMMEKFLFKQLVITIKSVGKFSTNIIT